MIVPEPLIQEPRLVDRKPGVSVGRRLAQGLEMAGVRLRIPLILLVAAILVGRWEVIRNYWDMLNRGKPMAGAGRDAVSNDTEYFCPMDPGVVSIWPSKCGVCNMSLVRRKRGDALVLPSGVVARMQISPYRVQLAGIRTQAVGYRALEIEHSAAGFCSESAGKKLVTLAAESRRLPWLSNGDQAEVHCSDLPGRDRFSGRVVSISRIAQPYGETLEVSVQVEDPGDLIRPGMVADVVLRRSVAELDPFASLPHDPAPFLEGEPRLVFLCRNHPDRLVLEPGKCEKDDNELEAVPLSDIQRLRWWCPMHPGVVSVTDGSKCAECGGMVLVPRIVSFGPAGQVLAIPESAVVDTGLRRFVFVESMPGVFDAIEVTLGQRCGEDYPVVGGLEAGQSVVIAGAFLLDAETRLNPSLAAGYFGAKRSRSVSNPTRVRSTPIENMRAIADPTSFETLSPADRALAKSQKLCPVTGKSLGSMGVPPKINISGKVVFLCCEGCESKLKKDPARYLAKLRSRIDP